MFGVVNLKRNAAISTTFKLGKERITINLDAVKITREFHKKYKGLVEAEKAAVTAIQQGNELESTFEAYGNAIFAIMDLFFGQAIREKIVAFYENNYIDMTQVIVPYILNKLLPKVQRILEEQRGMLAQKYGA